jgi:hypothetical protein
MQEHPNPQDRQVGKISSRQTKCCEPRYVYRSHLGSGTLAVVGASTSVPELKVIGIWYLL